jgi:hypothetical protein
VAVHEDDVEAPLSTSVHSFTAVVHDLERASQVSEDPRGDHLVHLIVLQRGDRESVCAARRKRLPFLTEIGRASVKMRIGGVSAWPYKTAPGGEFNDDYKEEVKDEFTASSHAMN